MSKENKRKIVVPFTLEQFEDAIKRIKAEYNAGNLNLVGLFEIEILEYYCEKVKDNEQVQKHEVRKMSVYWKSSGPAGFGTHTEIQPTLSLLVQNDGGYAITYGCSKVIKDGNIKIEIYYPPHKVKYLLKELENEKISTKE